MLLIRFALALALIATALPTARAVDGAAPIVAPQEEETAEQAQEAQFKAWLELDLTVLRRTLKQESMPTRARFYRWLPTTGRSELYPVTVDALHAEDALEIESAIHALVRIRVPLLIDNLGSIRELTAHHHPRVRYVACVTLGRLRDDLALEYLIDRLNDTKEISREAHKALKEISDTDNGTDPAEWTAWLQEWLSTEETIIPELIAKFEGAERIEKLKVMHQMLLFKSHRHQVGDKLAEIAAQENDPSMVTLAIDGMRNLGGVAALKSPEAVGRSITEVLGDLEDTGILVARERTKTTEEVDEGGIKASQIITLLVMLSLIGGVMIWTVRFAKKNPTRVRKLTSRLKKGTHRLTKSIKRKITFTR
ncbi:MAG: HEAT repeat domain-containing protein [Planctomycetota bacterium]|jgi:hypothetical protein|nr:HEAT repeat domain-containing protein [Planctomycetota bacterium]